MAALSVKNPRFFLVYDTITMGSDYYVYCTGRLLHSSWASGSDLPYHSDFLPPPSTFFQDLLSKNPSYGRKIAKFVLEPPYRR